MSVVQQIAMACAVGVITTLAAVFYGFVKGRAIGWQEGYFQREAWEKRRRDERGQFRRMTP